ncbi:hypothetical protein [Methylibium rhizosphaerae]|uniref:hypothetical protein n=1 Tax=Methylibium rhizosphaerae TaxID=2570323 RepID=UPI00112869C7|nr:hypothetical protein [Methylibium rhizosphaerae]
MPRFRVETVLDPATGRYFNELYYPEDSALPIAVSPAVYASIKDAEIGAVEALKRAVPDQPVKVIEPTPPQ